MAKKSRRARRKRRPAVKDAARAGVPASTGDEAGIRSSGPVRGSASDFARQYSYVYSDLKRIAVIAGTLLAALVALSFLID
jgi:hypothetical protein